MRELEYPFDDNLLIKAKKLKKELLKQDNLVTKKVALLSGSTIGQIKLMIELFLLQNGFFPVVYEGKYNSFYEEAVFPNDELNQFDPDIVYVHTTVRNIKEWPELTDAKEQTEEKLTELITRFTEIWDCLQENYHCLVIQNNFEMLPYRLMGNMDRTHPNGRQHFVEEANRLMALESQKRRDVFINDIHYQASVFGLHRWFDNSAWCAFKYAFSPEAFSIAAYNVVNIIKSYYGKNKKAVITDLDNTLWKGVIGDDGVDGIAIGVESPEGMPYTEFQEYLKELGKQGILLNICSKNELETGLTGFRHAGSVLTADDFTEIVCNWERKSDNIKEMADRLNLTPDSFVFIDDNPAEQDEVRESVEGIIVLPAQDISEMLYNLDNGGYFEVTHLSREDLNRKELYKARALFENDRKNLDYKDYLKGLLLKVTFDNVCQANIERVTQLLNKTNQFNLTGLRMEKGELEEFVPGNLTICATLSDKFGNNGLVSVVLGKDSGDGTLDIEAWIMSCRVFKRDLELAVFDKLVIECKKRGIGKIRGVYIPSKKNIPVAHLYKNLGFEYEGKSGMGESWVYAIPEKYEVKNQVIAIANADDEKI